jgi:hypothetical protein
MHVLPGAVVYTVALAGAQILITLNNKIAGRRNRIDSMKITDWLLGKEYFYIMHLSWGSNSRRKDLWDFARQKKVIGLDRSDVGGDWPTIREETEKYLRSINAHVWIKQFDMLCEDISPESMVNGDIVAVMAGKEHILGIGEVIGPHTYNVAYRLQERFFDHVRPVEWIIEYDYQKRKKIPYVEFQNTLRRIERNRPKDRKLWSLFSSLDFEATTQPILLPSDRGNSNYAENLKELADIQTKLTKETSQVSRYKRSRELVERLKDLYGYQCQLCSPTSVNIPQIPMRNGSNYVEVHHVRGFNEVSNVEGVNQEDADYIIDSYRNVITVCAYHHKLLHKHKDQFSYDANQKCFVSKDKSTRIPLVLNKHL